MKATINDIEYTIDKASYRRVELMREDSIVLQFVDATFHTHKRGETVSVGGLTGFALTEDYAPMYNAARGAYEYNIVSQRDYYLQNRTLVKLTADNQTYTKFPMTDTPSNILAFICQSAGWASAGNNTATEAEPEQYITVQFDGTNCIDALNNLVSAMDDNGYYEWWFDEAKDSEGKNVVHIGKLGADRTTEQALNLVEGNVAGVSVSKGESKRVTKVYALGGTKNMSARVGMDAPTINATKAKVVDGATYYWDEKHPISADMFKSSARIYPNVSQASDDGTQALKILLSKDNKDYTPHRIYGSQGVAIDSGKLTYNGSDMTVTIKPEQAHIVAGKVVVNVWLQKYIGNIETNIAFLGQKEQALMTGINATEFVVELKRSLGINAEGSSYRVYMEADLRDIEYQAFEEKEDIEVRALNPAQSPTLGISTIFNFRVEQRSVYSCDAGDGIIFNPLCKQVWEDGSKVFSASVSKKADALNIIRGKIPLSWYYETVDNVTMALGERRLSCIVGTGEEEEQVIFEEIFPHLGGTITEVGEWKREKETTTTGEETGREQIFYAFKTNLFAGLSTADFVDDTMKIAFLGGAALRGMEFETKIVSSNNNEVEIAIIPNEDYGNLIPNVNMFPKEGDEYTLYGVNAALYDENNVALNNAQTALQNAAEAYLERANADTNTYTCAMKNTMQPLTVSLGEPAKINYKGVKVEGNRIIGYKHSLDLKGVGMEIVVGNTTPYRRIDAIEKQLKKQ